MNNNHSLSAHIVPRGAIIWPFDNDLKSLDGLEPAPGHIVYLAPAGRFGGSVTIVEETTNMIPVEGQDFSEGWSAYQGSVVTVTQGVTVPEWKTNEATRIDTTGGTGLPKYLYNINRDSGYLNNKAFVVHVRVKNIGINPVRVHSNRGESKIVLPRETKLVILYVEAKESPKYLQLTLGGTTAEDELSLIVYQPMAEEKNFYTPFVEGTRAAGTLSYPDLAEQFNQREFTFAAWWKPYTELGIGSSIFDRFFQIDNGTFAAGNRIRLSRIYNSPGLRLGVPNAGGSGDQQYSFYANSYPSNTWHFVAVVLDVPNMKCRIHLNNEYQEFTISATPALLDLQRFFLGCVDAEGQLNGELDSVLYLSEAVPVSTVQAWSKLTRPFVPWREVKQLPTTVPPVEIDLERSFLGQVEVTEGLADEIYRNVQTIINTPAGTVPFDREFGINQDLLDMPMTQARGRLTIEYIEKIRRYEPRAKVKEVTFAHEPLNGVIKPRVVIELVD